MNITYVNALAFIGGIGLAAMQSESLPSEGGTMPVSKLQQVVSPAAIPSEATAHCASLAWFLQPPWLQIGRRG